MRIRPHLFLPVPIFDKDFRINHLDQRHLHLPITDISICVNSDFQGACDERPDLGVHDIVKLNIRGEHRANHFSFWFYVGGSETVMPDVTQPGYDFSPWIAKKYNSKNHTCLDTVVRFRQRRFPPTQILAAFFESWTFPRASPWPAS